MINNHSTGGAVVVLFALVVCLGVFLGLALGNSEFFHPEQAAVAAERGRIQIQQEELELYRERLEAEQYLQWLRSIQDICLDLLRTQGPPLLDAVAVAIIVVAVGLAMRLVLDAWPRHAKPQYTRTQSERPPRTNVIQRR